MSYLTKAWPRRTKTYQGGQRDLHGVQDLLLADLERLGVHHEQVCGNPARLPEEVPRVDDSSIGVAVSKGGDRRGHDKAGRPT